MNHKNFFLLKNFILGLFLLGCNIPPLPQPTLEEATTEETAYAIRQIIKQAFDEAMEDMESKFFQLSEEQQEQTEILTKQIVNEISFQEAKQTAERVARESIQEALKERLEQLTELSNSQIQVIQSASLEIANQIARETAQNIAQKQAEEANKQITTRLTEASNQQNQIAEEIATKTAENIAQTHIEEANKQIENELTKISNEQNETAKAVAEATTQNIATEQTEEAIKEMETRLTQISQEQQQIVEETASTRAQEIANQITNQAIENMEEEFANLSETEIRAIKEATLEIAEATAREVMDKVLEDLVNQTLHSITDQAIKNLENKHSEILETSLKTIMSSAIEALALAILPQSIDGESNELSLNDTVQKAINSATQQLAFTTENTDTDTLRGPSFNLAFEQCTWKNENYTTEIVNNHTFFPLSDPLTDLIRKWEIFKEESVAKCQESSINSNENLICERENEEINNEFAYLHPLYNDFVISFFQESIKNTNLSEKDIPLECFFASAVRGANLYGSNDNFYYCEENANRPSDMTVTDDQENTRTISAQRACINRDYVFLTAKVFNKTADCFGFNKAEKEVLFKLFNHESSFLHNVKSSTGARCYGQLTGVAIKEINKQIYFSNSSNPLPYSFIFDEVIERCSSLREVVLDPELYEERDRKSFGHFNTIVSRLPTVCKLTQDPYSCLFYALYNFKMNELKTEKELKTATTHFNTPELFKETFSLPILLGEMRGVTGTRDMIFWDDREIWNTLNNHPLESLSNIKTLPLFENQDEVRDLFTVWAYNGGITIADYMRDFIKDLKKNIAKPCSSDSQNKICQYRFAVKQGQGIATTDIEKDFQDYISRHYQVPSTYSRDRARKRRHEVSNFTSHVQSSLEYLYDKNGRFRYHLKNLIPEIESQNIENFQDHLQEICPVQ